jgi:hypothetical protein
MQHAREAVAQSEIPVDLRGARSVVAGPTLHTNVEARSAQKSGCDRTRAEPN